MNDPTNATIDESEYPYHFYQNPDSCPDEFCTKCGRVMNQEEKILLEGFPLLYEAVKTKAGFSRQSIGIRILSRDPDQRIVINAEKTNVNGCGS